MNALSAHLAPSTAPATHHAQPHIALRPTPQVVTSTVNYTKRPPSGEQLFSYTYEPSAGERPSNLIADPQQVQIRDIKTAQRHFSLQDNGFQLERLSNTENIDWSDEAQIHQRYYPEVEDLIKKVSGATRVHIFDHTLRKGHIQDGPLPAMRRGPVSRVHVDYNTQSGVDRMHAVMDSSEATELSKTPFAVIQVWKPLKNVEQSPLGMIDAQTVSKDDFMDLRLEFEGRTGYNYAIHYNPAHQFYYAKGMRTDEAYIFTCYDSRNNRARFTPHTGFADPTARPDAPERESIEIRAYAFWENEEPQPIANEL